MKVPPMVPSAEERFDATLSNGGVADHWHGIAAIEKAHRDGYAAGFAAALAMLRTPDTKLLARVADAMRHPIAAECDDNDSDTVARDVIAAIVRTLPESDR